jgi:hypothetical protein
VIAALMLFLSVPQIGGVGLAPGTAKTAPTVSAPTHAVPSAPEDSGGPVMPAALGASAALAAVLTVGAGKRSRRRDDLVPGGALGLSPPEDALVVFVPGHGNGLGPELFGDLVDMMDIDPDQVRYFDYRWATGSGDPMDASENASVDDIADALDGYLAGLADAGRPIYLVGFSKGGSSLAELVGRWDQRGEEPTNLVGGVALLEAPIASGPLGLLQSAGRLWGPIPDDGGYDPIECSFLGSRCRDTRENLGESSGVGVVVIRNPKAGITNLAGVPKGLRVYNAADDGATFFETLWSDPLDLPSRVDRAHHAVLSDPRVARCLVSEMNRPGTCGLPRAGSLPPAGLIGRGPGGAIRIGTMRAL